MATVMPPCAGAPIGWDPAVGSGAGQRPSVWVSQRAVPVGADQRRRHLLRGLRRVGVSRCVPAIQGVRVIAHGAPCSRRRLWGRANTSHAVQAISPVTMLKPLSLVPCGPGIMALKHPEAVQQLHIAISLLALSGVLEGASLWVAWKQVKLNAAAANMTLRQYLRDGSGMVTARGHGSSGGVK